MRRVLITGGCGFIGSELVNTFFNEVKDFERLVVLDRLDYCSRLDNINPEVKTDFRFKFIEGDICNRDLVKYVLEENNIDTIINMAAQTHVDRSFDDSLQFTRDNILGTHTLLETCRKWGGLKRFVHMSTDEVYGESSHDEQNPSDEKSLLNPSNPYAATKAGIEFILKSYGTSYKFPWVIVRGNNVYGHGQYPDKLIPKFTLQLHWGKRVTVHGDGSAKRTFVHVTDMARGIITVAQKGELGHIYNIGSRNEYSVLEITKLLCDEMGARMEESIQWVPDRNFNDKRYFISYSKVQALGWDEKISFKEGLRKTIDWYIERSDEYRRRLKDV